MADTLELETPHGTARAHLHLVDGAGTALVLGHGAGGGIDAPDLVALAAAAVEQGVSVVLVEQPYRVAGRRMPPRAPQLDASWIAVVDALRAGPLTGTMVYVGGRSMGSRVACRTAADVGAAGVVCLGFPLVPPARKGTEPGPSRLPELEAVGVPVLVVQGRRDAFGMPSSAPGRSVVQVAGDHSLKQDVPGVVDAVLGWLDGQR